MSDGEDWFLPPPLPPGQVLELVLAPRVAWAPLSTVVAPQHQASGGESQAGATAPWPGNPPRTTPHPVTRHHPHQTISGSCPRAPARPVQGKGAELEGSGRVVGWGGPLWPFWKTEPVLVT